MPKAAITASIEAEVPALSFSESGVRLFRCSGVSGALALADHAKHADLSVPQMLGVLTRERVCSAHYSLDCYVLSDDREGTGGREPFIWLVRPSGRVVHVGRARVDDDTIRFEVAGSVAPYANPVKVIGEMASDGALRVETALVGKPATDAMKAAVPTLRTR